MNRREFIKASIPVVAIPAIAITCKYEDDEKGPEKGSTHDPTKGEQGKCDWPYRVYCYERGQGEWTFSKNIRGSFAHQREYMTFEEDTPSRYAGWMDGGVLHFQTFDEAADFVEMHVRAKDDINLIDSIYDIYYRNVYHYDKSLPQGAPPTEYHIAHYWFNGDTGRQIHWEVDEIAELKDKEGKAYLVNAQTGERLTDWSKVECA
jgi:hypothetical protein